MALHPDVIRELTTATTPKRGATAAPAVASRQNALEAKVARLEAALSSCVQWGDLPKFVAAAFKEVGIQSTAARLDKLESRPQVKYQGVYRPGAEYSEGALVTRDGSIFHANRTTRASPGDGSMDWQLAVKRGQDGKSTR
jgi:hypothetical protein